MNRLIQQNGWTRARRAISPGRSAFTLIELLVSLVIIAVLMTLSAYAFRRTVDTSILSQARNSVLTYARVARAYAMANNIETMLVINPFNGRFEIWHLNPPLGGGPFDPLSGGFNSPLTDGYAFAPVLDPSARLPIAAGGRPAAAVNPVDYDDVVYRPTAADANEENLDNLTWTAICFSAEGQLVVRTRRIATRTYTRRDGTIRPAAERNRLLDETADLTLSPKVTANDSPITSTRGFVISDQMRMNDALRAAPLTPGNLIDRWLRLTRPGGRYADFATTVLLNRFSGQEEQMRGAQ
jgi:prepilin-type N-terminal cleavage/methylation domain-containing protein